MIIHNKVQNFTVSVQFEACKFEKWIIIYPAAVREYKDFQETTCWHLYSFCPRYILSMQVKQWVIKRKTLQQCVGLKSFSNFSKFETGETGPF